MTFSIYLDDALADSLNRLAKERGKSRNAVIKEALKDWLAQRRSAEWPALVATFQGMRGAPRFEQSRKTLKPPREPFDALSA
jgi:predicted transcriptional regulator